MRTYARFFSILKRLHMTADDRTAFIMQFTKGRTRSLREMENYEYNQMCDTLDDIVERREDRVKSYAMLRLKRSNVLHRMQLMGIDTSDWSAVDKVCMDVRIAGKRFRDLTDEDLDSTLVKLAIIDRKRNKQQQTLNNRFKFYKNGNKNN